MDIRNAPRNALTQLEYYFSNYNITRDKWMLDKLRESADQSLELSVVNDFPKLKAYGLTPEQLRDAAVDSPVVEVSSNLRVKRRAPIPANYQPEPLTLYTKGWPLGFTVDTIRIFFRDVLKIRIEHVGLRYLSGKERKFKGSAFIVFSTLEDCEGCWKRFGSQETETEETLARAKSLSELEPTALTEELSKNLIVLKLDTWKTDSKKGKQSAASKKQMTITKGMILKLTGIGRLGFDEQSNTVKSDFVPVSDAPKDQAPSRDVLKSVFSQFGVIKFIDFQPGAEVGYIRYHTDHPAAAEAAVKEYSSKELTLCGGLCKVELLAGDEELQYYEKIRKASDSFTAKRRVKE
ncbi:La ribonucleoprotein, putative [Giardia lamblia P15]|uniref:La ribonucleoprotein, putative n=1 Tax=Giardia intestinalis (strain P15) TaxID=658858 RepID=E1F504_GIAIA|nr:La ribonucleoprotein, putative [Giardia lamblia P15]